jgi:hypothetical protein
MSSNDDSNKPRVKFVLKRQTLEELKSEDLGRVVGGEDLSTPSCSSAACCTSGCKTDGDPANCPPSNPG